MLSLKQSYALERNRLEINWWCCQVLGWTLLNSTVALVGYYVAAFTVDKPWMGRRRMQVQHAVNGQVRVDAMLTTLSFT